MKKIIIYISLLCIIIPACAQAPNDGLLWKISGNGLEKPSYILGTWHGTYDIMYNFTDSIPGFAEAFDNVEQVIGELDMNPATASLPNVNSSQGLLPAGLTYDVLLSEPQLKLLDSVLLRKLGTPYSSQLRMRPMIMFQILHSADAVREMGIEEYKNKAAEVMDMKLQTEAIARGYKTAGLETVEEQVKTLVSRPLEEEIKLLIAYLESGDKYNQSGRDMAYKLRDAYRNQSLRKVELFEEGIMTNVESAPYFDTNSFMDALLTVRNNNWVERLPSMIASTPSLIAVGVRHLPGDNGFLNLLRQAGYTVEPVKQ